MSPPRPPRELAPEVERAGEEIGRAVKLFGRALFGGDFFEGIEEEDEDSRDEARTIDASGPPPEIGVTQIYVCKTCNDTKSVGRPGYRVTCPACPKVTCYVCGGSGRVGNPGHEVPCPTCA